MECHYCRARLTRRTSTRDHVVPIARGGQDKPWNIVLACRPCNEAKSSDWPTCDCGFCAEAIRRHPNAWGRPLRERPKDFQYAPRNAARGGEGPRCRDCGEITMSPQDCPWCGNVAKVANRG